jgi:hypothetical protein
VSGDICDVVMVSSRFFVTASLVPGGFSVMAGWIVIVLRRFFVVFCSFFSHKGYTGSV